MFSKNKSRPSEGGWNPKYPELDPDCELSLWVYTTPPAETTENSWKDNKLIPNWSKQMPSRYENHWKDLRNQESNREMNKKKPQINSTSKECYKDEYSDNSTASVNGNKPRDNCQGRWFEFKTWSSLPDHFHCLLAVMKAILHTKAVSMVLGPKITDSVSET